tara:strand:- start:1039 stop:1614 length:576 start_codon:yes stop_codon:yes gene_type:complete
MILRQELTKYLGAMLLAIACLPAWSADAVPETIVVSSTAFDHDTDIPWQYSAYGEGISPAISWSNLPEGTRQLALILDDPVVGTLQPFVHWIAYNIPATAPGLPEGLSPDAIVTHPGLEGMINGANGIRRSGYFGPRPPADGKVHTYNFRIYALDHELNLDDGLNKASLLDAMRGHILATGLLTGNFQYTE